MVNADNAQVRKGASQFYRPCARAAGHVQHGLHARKDRAVLARDRPASRPARASMRNWRAVRFTSSKPDGAGGWEEDSHVKTYQHAPFSLFFLCTQFGTGGSVTGRSQNGLQLRRSTTGSAPHLQPGTPV